MEWLANNATNGYFLLAFAAFMLAGVWWIQKQLVYLIGAGVALVALAVFWLVIHNVPTTEARLEAELKAKAAEIEGDLKSLVQALLAKDQAKAVRFVAADLKYDSKDREKWYVYLEKKMAEGQVDAIELKQFKVKKYDAGKADVDFVLEAKHKGEVLYSKECPWKLVRDGETWQVTKVSLRKVGAAKKGDD